ASGAFLKFSREDEREADRVGLELMSRAGWDSRGMVEMFEILKKEAGRDPTAVEAFFSTHPTPKERIKEISTLVAGPPKGGPFVQGGPYKRDSREFQVIRKRVVHNRKSG